MNHFSSTLTLFHPEVQCIAIHKWMYVKCALTVLLDLTSSVERAIKNLGHAIFLLCRRILKDLRPTMLPKQKIPVLKTACNLNNDHVGRLDGIQKNRNRWVHGLSEQEGFRCTYRRFVEESEKHILAYARRDPVRELLLVAQQLHVSVWRVWVHHSQVFGLIVRRWRGFFSLRHR